MSRYTENPMSAAILTPFGADALLEHDASIEEVANIYPYVPGKCGIDFASIVLQFQSLSDDGNRSVECAGGSGRNIYVKLGRREIGGIDYDMLEVSEREASKKQKRFLKAFYSINTKTLGFNLRTKSKHLKRRHPDFFAGKFIEFAIQYFEQLRDEKIEKVKGLWVLGSDNYDAFFKAYDKEGKDKTYLQKGYLAAILAARSTWTGRTLSRLGFTEIEWVELRSFGEGCVTLRGDYMYTEVGAVFSRQLADK